MRPSSELVDDASLQDRDMTEGLLTWRREFRVSLLITPVINLSGNVRGMNNSPTARGGGVGCSAYFVFSELVRSVRGKRMCHRATLD